jgi:SAM-dependent methyltransferase
MNSTTLRQLLDRHPVVKAGLKTVLRPFRRDTSADYRRLSDNERAPTLQALSGAWRDDSIPQRQRAGVDRTLAEYRGGAAIRDFDSLVDLLRPLAAAAPGSTVLEIGCSSGYYADVLAARGIALAYSGCDFSRAFVDLARRYHPDLRFDVEDATELTYADASVDIVVSGCCLLHIADYPRAIAETARVARRHAVFHRTPVLARHATRFFTKTAYGVKTVEIHFGESELVALFAAHGLRVVGIETISADWRDGDAFAIKTYLCAKGTD